MRQRFPDLNRELLIFLAVVVIVSTLVLQGGTLQFELHANSGSEAERNQSEDRGLLNMKH